jgi:hypothetical protein
MGAVAFDLLIRGNGAEDDFGELASFKGTVRDASLIPVISELTTTDMGGSSPNYL